MKTGLLSRQDAALSVVRCGQVAQFHAPTVLDKSTCKPVAVQQKTVDDHFGHVNAQAVLGVAAQVPSVALHRTATRSVNAGTWRSGHRQPVEGWGEVGRADRNARGMGSCPGPSITGITDGQIPERGRGVGEVQSKPDGRASVDEHVLHPSARCVDLHRRFSDAWRFRPGSPGAGHGQAGDVRGFVIRVIRPVFFVDQHTSVHAVGHVQILDDRAGAQGVVDVANHQTRVGAVDAHPLEQGDAVLDPHPCNIGP